MPENTGQEGKGRVPAASCSTQTNLAARDAAAAGSTRGLAKEPRETPPKSLGDKASPEEPRDTSPVPGGQSQSRGDGDRAARARGQGTACSGSGQEAAHAPGPAPDARRAGCSPLSRGDGPGSLPELSQSPAGASPAQPSPRTRLPARPGGRQEKVSGAPRPVRGLKATTRNAGLPLDSLSLA